MYNNVITVYKEDGMKKAAVLLYLLISISLCSCAPGTVRSGGVVVRSEAPKPADIVSYYENEDIVYVTVSGEKYHRDGCPYLKSSKIMISLEQAVMEGKTPCSRCFGDGDD
jgi:hypothetical protein